ncbi:MAG TPA: hypothetical protein VN081_03900 [Dongiaceae bacterium]|nr:hypothetical protein [Dongiaceae bacterium]
MATNGNSFYSTQEGYNNIGQAKPNDLDAWGALFNESSLTTLGRSYIDRTFVENPQMQQNALRGDYGAFAPIGQSSDYVGEGLKAFIPISEANKKYGLNLNPSNGTNTISEGLAQYLYRKQTQHAIDQNMTQAYQPNFVQRLGAGLGASVTDPVETAINLLPIGKLASGALGTVGRFGENTVARWAARAAENPLLHNQYLMGAVEGAGQTALTAPGTAANAKVLGREYSFDDAMMDIGIGGLAGGLLQGGLHTLFGEKGHPTPARLHDESSAIVQAQNSFANGDPVDASKTVDRSGIQGNAAQLRRDLTQEILKQQDAEKQGVLAQSLNQPATETTPFDLSKVQPLPASLSKSSPRFGSMPLTFDNDLDKALYIIGKQGEKSNAHDKFLQYVREQLPHMDDEQIGELAIKVRQEVVDEAKTGVDTIGRKADQHIPGEPRPAAPDISPDFTNNPLFDSHTNPLEKRLLAVNDPEGFKAVLNDHASKISAQLARLGEFMAMPKAEFAQHALDAKDLQAQVLADIAHLNDIVPTGYGQISDQVPTTKAGLFRKDALNKLGAEIGRLNEKALSLSDPAHKLELLNAEYDRLRKELKHASQSLQQAQTKGTPTAAGWAEKVAHLTPQLQHAEGLLQAFGQATHTPELSLGHYIMTALGGEVNDHLLDALKADPDMLDNPVYRVRNKVFDNVSRRLYQTEQYLRNTDPGTVRPSMFPENDAILADVKKELADMGEVDPDKFHEELFNRVNQDIQAQKALGIFSDKDLERFDKIEETFKNNVEKTQAIKKGAVQAQLCALGGVEED